ncbi:MAG TPA: hypothetical protein VF337_01935 [Candidatus Limnocylindrales bacterium]
MADFDFVADDDLRASLEADAIEMNVCLQNKAYKAAHVMAGSIVEAVLVHHLQSTNYTPPGNKQLFELSFGQLIDAARTQKVLSDRAAALSSVIKDYRNLIHPGRLIRLGEKVDGSTADVAKALVDIVANEIADLRQETYGYTAQQILTKVERDSSSVAILTDLLRTAKQREIERLLIHDLPARYVEIATDDFADSDYVAQLLARFRRTYRAAFEVAPEDVRRRVMAEYAKMLREEVDESTVLMRERGLFRAADMEYMDQADVPMTTRHLLARIGTVQFDVLDDCLIGIGAYCDGRQLHVLVDACLKHAQKKGDEPIQLAARFLPRLHDEAPEDRREAIIGRLEDWERTFEGKNVEMQKWVIAQREWLSKDWGELPF